MNYLKCVIAIFIFASLIACNEQKKESEQEKAIFKYEEERLPADTLEEADTHTLPVEEEKNIYEDVPDTAFVVMHRFASGFAYELKYATDDNFLKKAVYTCDHCMLRKEVAEALKQINDSLMRQGFRIKFFDCYRPLSVQKKMWELYPNPRYLANPYTIGSNHNRGGAVDITLVDLEGNELDMGTGFDHFGREAHHAYSNLPDTVLNNRKLLKETMEAFGFNSITSEWWHYNFKSARKYPVSNVRVECD